MTQRVVDGVDVRTSDCGLHECFLGVHLLNIGKLERTKHPKTVPSQDWQLVGLCFSSLFFGRVARLGGPRRSEWICGMKGDQPRCQCKSCEQDGLVEGMEAGRKMRIS